MKQSPPIQTRALFGHVLRLATVAAVAWLVHATHEQRQAARATLDLATLPLAAIHEHLPEVVAVGGVAPRVAGGRELLDSSGNTVGVVLRTSPAGDAAIGFSGPTDLLVVCDANLTVVGMSVLSSGDTRDHVRAIEDDARFWQSFAGMPLADLAEPQRRRSVAGATLTSRAIVEALSLRVGGTPPPSRFDRAPELADLARLFPAAEHIETDPGDAAVIRVRDADRIPLGWALRTSPAADGVIGYQGPTDAIVGFDTENRVAGVLVLTSFDNEPYVGYVRDDRAFRKVYRGMPFEELATIDPAATGIEGVSGATMTSQAVAEGIVRAAATHQQTTEQAEADALPARLTAWLRRIEGPQWGAIVVMFLGVLTAFTRARGNRWGRLALPVIVFAYLGFGAGALLSLGQFAGWVEAGVPPAASVLTVLTVIAVAAPITTKRNVYCSHLCAHGAAQQVLKQIAKPKRSSPRWLRSWLSRLPFALLAFAILAVVLPLPVNLVDLEPFDGYLLGVAGVAALVIFAVSLVASLFVPMAYCRYGCPTGALLDHLRLNRHSGRFSWRDTVLLACLISAAIRYGSLL
jgi:NosR/NirI family nitrous oxide reductase transcriptional regulator